MREIKFRVWDEKCKKMFYSDFDKNTHKESNNYRFNFYENGCLIFEIYDFNVVDGVVHEDWITLDNVMQYTGLKDKNGQEIYEGDILKLQDRLVRVVWLKGGATFDTKFIKYTKDIEHRMGFCEVDNYSWHRYEVVGNIYENPELVR